MIAKRTAGNFKFPTNNQKGKQQQIDEWTPIKRRKRQANLINVIRNIYAYKRKIREGRPYTTSAKENYYHSAKIAKRLYKWARRPKNMRKCGRPRRLSDNRITKDFMFYCKKKDRKPKKKVHRGYINKARKIVEHDIRVENFNLNQNAERFYRDAKILLTGIMRSRHRARFALCESIQCLKEWKNGHSGIRKSRTNECKK